MTTQSLKRLLCAATIAGLLSPAALFGQAATPSAGEGSGTPGTTSTPGTTGTPGTTETRPGSPTTPAMGSDAKSLSSGDKKFIQEAASAGLAEVQLGQLAASKAENPLVKEFGERMVREHDSANDELERIAATKGVELPTEPDDKHRRKLQDLEKKSGAAFDRAYMSLMLDEHQKDVKEFERQAKRGSDPQVKAFAEKTLGSLREHLQEAKNTESAIKSGAKSAAKKDGSAY